MPCSVTQHPLVSPYCPPNVPCCPPCVLQCPPVSPSVCLCLPWCSLVPPSRSSGVLLMSPPVPPTVTPVLHRVPLMPASAPCPPVSPSAPRCPHIPRVPRVPPCPPVSAQCYPNAPQCPPKAPQWCLRGSPVSPMCLLGAPEHIPPCPPQCPPCPLGSSRAPRSPVSCDVGRVLALTELRARFLPTVAVLRWAVSGERIGVSCVPVHLSPRPPPHRPPLAGPLRSPGSLPRNPTVDGRGGQTRHPFLMRLFF